MHVILKYDKLFFEKIIQCFDIYIGIQFKTKYYNLRVILKLVCIYNTNMISIYVHEYEELGTKYICAIFSGDTKIQLAEQHVIIVIR